MNTCLHLRRAFLPACALGVLVAAVASAQPAPAREKPRARGAPRDTVVRASTRYGGDALHRYFLGDDYRDLWGAPIRVPMLNLREYAGGLKATEEGGGAQTKNLHLEGRDGRTYVFRPVYKTRLGLPDNFEGTIAEDVFRDELSASHPAANVMAPPIMAAAGILHPTPSLIVMPDDSLLGKFREDFAGRLGTIEELPKVPDDAPGLGGAVEIIDSEDLLKRLNRDPAERPDARAYLAARLCDMLMNDNDRHPGQWKWARLRAGTSAPWEPIARDRDKAFESFEGALLSIARLGAPKLVRFDSTYPDLQGLSYNAIDLDRRLLSGLDLTVWDSVAAALTRAITDSVIDAAVHSAPRAYWSAAPELAAKTRARRDRLPQAARRYFASLNRTVDLHATDADDRAAVVRQPDGSVDVTVSDASGQPYIRRHFDPVHTSEVRLYLHNGDDRALVTGRASHSIVVRIVGGNGTNVLVDSSSVNGKAHPTHLYDAGRVDNIRYDADTVDHVGYDPDTSWNRRPWAQNLGRLTPPGRDRGSSVTPVAGLTSGYGLGLVPKIGFKRYAYGFRTEPYASMLGANVSYSTGVNGLRAEFTGDWRRENSPLHLMGSALMSQLEVIEFHGLGNDRPDEQGTRFDVRQREWLLHPAAGYSLGPHSELAAGPVLRYVVTDPLPGTFLADSQPYGAGHFGDAGLRLELHHDSRDEPGNAHRGILADVSGSVFPALWDVKSPYAEIAARASVYFRIPMPARPVVALRAGGQKNFGETPYYDAAFIGGSNSVRTFRHNQYLGDASIFGNAEVRVPVTKFAFILPLDFGLIGFGDAGRVFQKGESPGGWHSVAAAGFWLGVVSPATSLSVMLTNRSQKRVFLSLGFSY